MPRPRAAECTPETRGRVRATDAAACGCKHDAPGVWQIFAGHQSELGLVQRPRADGASRERSECRETASRWDCDACGLNLDDGLSPAGKAAMAPRRRLGGSRGPLPACWRGIWPAVAVTARSTNRRRSVAPSCLRAPAVRARGRAGRARVVALYPNCGTQQLRAQRDHVARYNSELLAGYCLIYAGENE